MGGGGEGGGGRDKASVAYWGGLYRAIAQLKVSDAGFQTAVNWCGSASQLLLQHKVVFSLSKAFHYLLPGKDALYVFLTFCGL